MKFATLIALIATVPAIQVNLKGHCNYTEVDGACTKDSNGQEFGCKEAGNGTSFTVNNATKECTFWSISLSLRRNWNLIYLSELVSFMYYNYVKILIKIILSFSKKLVENTNSSEFKIQKFLLFDTIKFFISSDFVS